jgi:AraC-like DNA-binding protein
MHPLTAHALLPFEPIGFQHVVMVGWQSSEQAEYAVLPHFHPAIFECHVVARGQVSYLIDGQYHTMSGGDSLLIQPGVPHGTVEEPLGRCERYWLQIRAPQPGGYLLGQSPESSRQISRQLELVPTRPFRGSRALVPLMEQIVAAYRDENDPLRVVNLRNLILRTILDFLALAQPNATSADSSRIQQAIELIEQSKAPVSLADLANAAGMSESAFKLSFKKQTGLPPVEFATRHRIETARGLLLATKRPITDIAHELGFSSSQHFATAFRRYSGQSPNEFRSGANALHRSREPIAGAGVSFDPLIYLRQGT